MATIFNLIILEFFSPAFSSNFLDDLSDLKVFGFAVSDMSGSNDFLWILAVSIKLMQKILTSSCSPVAQDNQQCRRY